MTRRDKISQAGSSKYDVVVIGGGITGAGIFLKCCRQGLNTLLVDRDDFAAGTSSRSAKMIHGGLRYLQYLQVNLVREALEERNFLLEHYAHLVKPLPFLMPVYDSQFARMKIKVGLAGYDALAGSSKLPRHRSLTSDEVRKTYPMLREKGLKGGFYYYDAITNDARLTNEVIMQGCQAGGTAINYVTASFPSGTSGSLMELDCHDELNDVSFSVRADHYISAAGIWSDEFLRGNGKAGSAGSIMKPSKGVHIVVDGAPFPKEDVLLVPCEDKRFIWICPWENGLVIIGATDTAFSGDLREPGTTKADIRYLLDNANRYLRNVTLTEDDILSMFSGLRPLLNEEGESDTVKMSRDYKVWWEKDNLLAIAGGKLTSFLSMADHVLEKLLKKQGSVRITGHPAGESAVAAIEVIRQQEAGAGEPLPGFEQHDVAEVIYFVRKQHAEKISDVLTRRLSLSYGLKDYDEALISAVAGIMQRELGWSDAVLAQRLADYRRHWETLHSCIN
jgi:glycerol-3-phosphate dehydrogenase